MKNLSTLFVLAIFAASTPAFAAWGSKDKADNSSANPSPRAYERANDNARFKRDQMSNQTNQMNSNAIDQSTVDRNMQKSSSSTGTSNQGSLNSGNSSATSTGTSSGSGSMSGSGSSSGSTDSKYLK
jgi:hypothetical protein